jgi:thioredoxin 1
MNAYKKLIDAEVPVVVDFFATWCGPCKAMAPELDNLKKKMGDAVKIVKIDIDKNKKLATQLQIQSVPTLMIYKNKRNVYRKAGVHHAGQLEQILKTI